MRRWEGQSMCALFKQQMDHLQIPFGTEISLRSRFNSKFMGFRHANQLIAACFPPANIYSHQQSDLLDKKEQPLDMALRFRLVAREGEKGANINEGSRVYLVNASTEEYLTSTSKGELKFDKKSLSEEMNKMLFKSASWVVSLAASQRSLSSPSRAPLSPYDQLVFKSVYGAYLTIHATTLNCQAIPQMDEVRSVWSIQPVHSIVIPQWLFQKPSFCKFLKLEGVGSEPPRERRNLRSQPPETQQSLLVEDILDIMLGFEGTYIKRKPGTTFFVIEPHLESPSCNVALAQLVYRILQLPSYFERLMRFIQQLQLRESTLSQSLCDGLRTLINEYKGFVIQLDEQAEKGLSLQFMWFRVQNNLKIMRALSELVAAAGRLKGGQLLSCLLKLINDNTDQKIDGIYRFLYNKLIALYVNLLSLWIYEGVVDDRFGQFMILAEPNSQGDWNYWQERFSLRPDQTPSLLQRDAQRILVTGKYLNILKACSHPAKHPHAGSLQKNLDYYIGRQNFSEPIQKAYDWANEQLLQLIFTQYKLQEVLQSLKGYYFLRFGDLFGHFMDAAEEDLSAQKKSKTDNRGRPFSVQKLQNLFELNVRVSSAANDPIKQDVSCRLDSATLFEQVHRIKTLESQVFEFDFKEKPFIKKDSRYVDFVTLEYKCSFPLSLILNRKSMSKYQCLFRLILWCKFLQRQLGTCWVKLQGVKETGMPCFIQPYILNHKMLNFVKSLVYYLTEQVIEQNWFKLSSDLKRVKNFEEIIECHDRFLNNCLKEALLTNSKLLPLLTSDIGNTINNYFFVKNYLSKIQEEITTIKQARPTNPTERRKYLHYIRGTMQDLFAENEFKEFVDRSSAAFMEVIRKFIRQVSLSTGKEENHLLRLGEMLDEQNYVQRKSPSYFQS